MIYFYAIAGFGGILVAMKRMGLMFLLATLVHFQVLAQDLSGMRGEAATLLERGMWQDVLDHYREKLLPISDSSSGMDLERAAQALGRLGAWSELDSLVEQTVERHPDNPHILHAAASAYRRAPHAGRIIAGEFVRGSGDSPVRPFKGLSVETGGAFISTEYRDRIRVMQLLRDALAKAGDDSFRLKIWIETEALLGEVDAWKLQSLTPLDSLPDWSEPGPDGGTEGAPWQGNGPVLYPQPPSWEAARNDGQRWRFALVEQIRLSPDRKSQVTMKLAGFSRSQFGTETLNRFYGWDAPDPQVEKGVLEIDTLAENECLAKTSAGIRRFILPDDQHFIALYRSLLEDRTEGSSAGDALVDVFLSRRQYAKARAILEKTISQHGPGPGESRKILLQQITGNWGRFEPAPTVPAGVEPTIPLVFRNAGSIQITLAPLDMDAVLRDTIDHLKSNPPELDWELLNPALVAQRLISGKESRYIGKPTETLEIQLEPLGGHRDTRTNLKIPIPRAGAWWVTGAITGGNSFHTLVWVVDSVIAHHDVAGGKLWWLADAAGGKPVDGAKLDFFGYRIMDQNRNKPGVPRSRILTKSFQRMTDADGATFLKPGDFDPDFQWLAIARKDGRFAAFHGFQPLQISLPEYENGNRDIGYAISDRPLYQPGDKAHLKFFLRNVGYFKPDASRWSNKIGKLVITNGRGEQVIQMDALRTDDRGSVETDVILPKDAALGSWLASYQVEGGPSASVALRVEEFRKPEFEVIVNAPEEPVKLGERFSVTIRANYFHGSPVRKAKVELTVNRSSISNRGFPGWRWDWLYGAGAWWNGSQATWHPTWERWGCLPPQPPWWRDPRWTPDEGVMKREVEIGEDGSVVVEIDTAPAKAIHGDLDSRYTIEARVVDASRREQLGTGSVIAARKPFEVIVWTDPGHARSGDAVEATISAATLEGKPVLNASGNLKLLKLAKGDDGRIVEMEIQSWPVSTDADGRISVRFPASDTGQYRLAATLAVDGGEAVEGGLILNVHGPGRVNPGDWNFGPLELVADKTVLVPGETLKLRVNSDFENANVWLFLYVAGASGREARRIELDGKSLEVEIPIELRDMPNMFIEAFSVHGARVHSAVRQIFLPPIDKQVQVSLEPSKSKVGPRGKSSLLVTLRDAEGSPVVGTAVLSIYDKSLEAITAGSNVGLIHEAFWNWKNPYYGGDVRDTIPRSPGNLPQPKSPEMISLDSHGLLPIPRSMKGAKARGLMMEMGGMAPMAASHSSAADSEGLAQPAAPSIPVRSEFADSLKWSGTLEIGSNGMAEVPIEFPDNLTTWKARLWVLTKDSRVGEASAEFISSKDLMVRLQAPRFLVERDEAVLSAVVQNEHDLAKSVTVSLELGGKSLQAIDGNPQTIEIAAKSEARLDWRVRAVREGQATVRMRADSGQDGDAVENSLAILIHGMPRQEMWSRMLEPGVNVAKMEIDVPADRRTDASKLTVRLSPSIAAAVVDAIPYLADYPHHSTDQTVNRFVPAVVAREMLRSMNVNLAEIKAKRANLNPQELGHAADRAKQWREWQSNPVFDELELDRRVRKGVEKLMAMQNSDGGWGWFSGDQEHSIPHTTAVVVHGLLLARANGVEIPDGMLASGTTWLAAYERMQADALQRFVETQSLPRPAKSNPSNKWQKPNADALDSLVRLVLGEAKLDSQPMLAFLHRDRLELPVYAKCLLAIEHHRMRDMSRRDEVMAMIAQYLKRDPENQTCFLNLENNSHGWHWYGSHIEAHAWYLKLLTAVKPDHPDARGLVKYLVNQRKNASYWESTRDTAFAVEAIADYFKASGEDAPDQEIEVFLNGSPIGKYAVNRDNLFSQDNTIVLTGDQVATGKQTLEIRRSGKGTLYANAFLEVFTLEENLRPAGLEIKLDRRVTRLVPLETSTQVPDSTGQIATQATNKFRREPLTAGAKLNTGDRIEVELVLKSKNDYEYLVISDAKAAGFEAVDSLSGYTRDDEGLHVYREPRAATVDFFIRQLPRGTHSLRYELRAETPGVYKALPATMEGIYAPELRANSQDIPLEIVD
jgi:uncharacterized protein YfaS (alpha-2-macroglobulin family)